MLKYLSPAKINLMLKVTGVRANGYHNIVSVMQSVAIYDELTFDFDVDDFEIICNINSVPVDGSNIIARCWKTMKEQYNLPMEVSVNLKKNIPLAAGLAGGSGNGAAMIIAANDHFNLGLSKAEMGSVGVGVGADIPYCIYGGTGLVSGIGETVLPLPNLDNLWLILVNPGIEVNTATVYKAHDQLLPDDYDYQMFIDNVRDGDIRYIKDNLYNDLERITIKWHSVIDDIKNDFIKEGMVALMSGSGSTVFAIAADELNARNVYEKFLHKYPNMWLCHTSKEGVICE